MLSIIIKDVLLWAVVILGIPLALVRWKKGHLDPPLALSIVARAVGTITLLLGGAHLLEIGGAIMIGRRPYDLRNVEPPRLESRRKKDASFFWTASIDCGTVGF
jgi:hypothetical protein